MRSKDLSLDNGSQGQVIKELRQHFPDVVILVLPHTLIIKTVVLGDASGFMVASEDGESFFVSNLEAEEEADSFEGVVASIHVISQEEIVSIGDIPSDSEEFHEVVELPVDVTADVDWCADVDDIGFFGKDFSG